MQRLRLTVKTRRDSSRRSSRDASRPHYAALGFMLLCLSLSTGCADPDPQADSIEAFAEEGAGSPAVDSLISDEGDRSVAQQISDASVATAVQLALVDHRDLRTFPLEPVAVNGHVVLQGEVETLAQRERAESVASGVAGVRGVINRIISTETPAIAEAREDRAPDDQVEHESDDAADRQADDPLVAAEAPSSSEPAASESEATYHTVEYGDNLWDIARAHNVSVEQITRLNDLGSSSIKPGQRLQVK